MLNHVGGTVIVTPDSSQRTARDAEENETTTVLTIRLPKDALNPQNPDSFINPDGSVKDGLAWFIIKDGKWVGFDESEVPIVLDKDAGVIRVTLKDGGPEDGDGLADGKVTVHGAPGYGFISTNMNSKAFVAWATEWVNPVQYGDTGGEYHRNPIEALGKAEGNFTCIGEGGSITMTFKYPITNSKGWDFAVFEDLLSETTFELAYVEVSSDGKNFVRFDNNSFTPEPGIWGYVEMKSSDISGLAGSYKAGYGTPFDLEDLKDKPEILNGTVDLTNITHIRIIDVIGGENKDTNGNIIYDATYYGGGTSRKGFDLDAIGVIHQNLPSALPGDVNNDGKVSLQDAILALKVIAGIVPPETIRSDADVSGDNKIGMEEVIYILRQVLK